MNRLGKIITTGLVVASMGVIGANAETIDVENKSYTFTEFEVKDELGRLVKYNNKDYVFKPTAASGNLSELIYDDKVKIQDTDINKEVIDEVYPNGIIDVYNYSNLVISSSSTKASGIYGSLGRLTLNDIIVTNNIYMAYNHLNNDKLYLHSGNDTEQYIYQLQTSPAKVIKTIKMSDLINTIKEDGYEYKNGNIYTLEYINTLDPFIELTVQEEKTETKETTIKTYIFNIDGTLYTTLKKEILNTSNGVVPIYNNGKVRFIYSTCKEQDTDCELILTEDEEDKTILKTDDAINYEVNNGFTIIKNNGIQLYNNDFKLIKDYSNAKNITIMKEKNSEEDFKYSKLYKEIQNDNYLITIYDNDNQIISNELLTVSDKKEENNEDNQEVLKTKISGILKDSKGKTLEDYKVELNDLTTTTDKNGYFSFENIEEGVYTLVIKDKEGKVIFTKTITVKNGEDIKLEEDILYFKENGVNLNLKLTSDNTIEIESVDEYKNHNEINPQTYDKTIIGIIGLMILSILLFIINRKYKKLNS